jgi:hypothetical protein
MPTNTNVLAGGKRSRRARSRKNKGRSRRRTQRGGAGAAEYMVDTFGSDYSQQVGKVITSNMSGAPNAQQLALIQAGGRRRSKGRTRRGGNLGAILSNAAPSLALMGLAYRYGKKRR